MADEKDIAQDEAPAGGGRKRLLLIGIVAAAVLLLGGAAAALLLGGDDGTAGEAGADEVVEEERGDPLYHRLDPEFIVNLPPGGPAKMLQVAIEVLTYNPAVVERLEDNDPMIRHHLLNLLERQRGEQLLTQAGKQALRDAVSELLRARLDELGEPGRIKGVYFTQFVMQ